MSLFSSADIAKINQTAKQSTKILEETNKAKKSNKSITSQLEQIYQKVLTHFQDSDAILINSKELLDEYIDKAIEDGYVGIDTETTGLDRQKDYIVGMSLYYMNGDKCYIPNKHLVPIFDEPYSGQLTYQDCHDALERLMGGGVKFIFANADYDLSMIYKDYKIDLLPNFYADVILAWRCLKEDELDNRLKSLYYKYVEKSKGDGMQFSDLFTPELFRYAKPEIAKYYAANDPDITLKLFMYELQFLNKQNPLCKKHKLERIADLYWKLEIPMVGICQRLHRDGMYIDNDTCEALKQRYNNVLHEETHKLQEMVQNVLDSSTFTSGLAKRPFVSGKDFNPKSAPHVNYLLYKVMNLPPTNGQQSTGRDILAEFNLPITKQILKVRSINVLISTFVDKLPKAVGKDNRIHAQFKQVGASTGRMCIAKGTKITCLNKDKNIEDIHPGDIVFCYDEEHTCIQLAKVKNLWLTGKDRECVKIKWYSYGEQTSGELICTPEHPILKKNGSWVQAHTLTQKDKIFRLKRKNRNIHELDLNIKDISLLTDRKDDIMIDHTHEITSVEPCGKYEVYDIEVEGYHNFIANELLVHNSSADPNLQNIPSHAIDIRHMFRATPEKIEDIKYENGLYLKIHDSLKTNEGWKYGDEITENDIIVDIAEREYKVLQVSIHSGNVTLILDNVEQNTLFSVKHSAYVMLSSDYS